MNLNSDQEQNFCFGATTKNRYFGCFELDKSIVDNLHVQGSLETAENMAMIWLFHEKLHFQSLGKSLWWLLVEKIQKFHGQV